MSCESARGEWGKVCPDCGVRLPERKPIVSWMSRRHQERPADETQRAGPWHLRTTIPKELRVPGVCATAGCGEPVVVPRAEGGGRPPAHCSEHVRWNPRAAVA